MALTVPDTSERNRVPSSVPEASGSGPPGGPTVELHRLHGQVRAPTVTGTLTVEPMFALSSMARTMIDADPAMTGVQEYDQDARPVAGCQVLPPSVEISTPPTAPPPVSLAVPLTFTATPPGTVAPEAGEDTETVGPTVSVDLVARVSPLCRAAGCAPMSASRFTVACFIGVLAAPEPRSWLLSRPQDHCTVPAPKTSAPLGAR